MRRQISLSVVILFVYVASGCKTSGTDDLVAAGHVRSELTAASATRAATMGLILPPPAAKRVGEALVISGTVSKRPGATIPKGHIDLDIDTPAEDDGEVLQLVLTPAVIPEVCCGISKYEVSYGVIPPRGTTIRVAYSTDIHFNTSGDSGSASLGSSPYTRTPGTPPRPSTPGRPTGPARGGGRWSR